MMDDHELRRLLEEWRTPEFPVELESRIFAQPTPWWKWPLTGQVRLPVPVLLATLALLVWSLTRTPPTTVLPPTEVDVVNFQPVTTLNPRIIRSTHAND